MSDAQIPDDELKALEREVGDLLSEAESLGDQLAAEVGTSPSTRAAGASEPADPFSDTDISGRLAQAESELHEAAEQLGAEPAPVKKPKKISLPPKGAAPRLAPSGLDSEKPERGEPAPPALTAGAARQPAQRSAPAATSPTANVADRAASGVERLVAARVEAPLVELPPRPALSVRIRALLPLSAVGHALDRTARGIVLVLDGIDRPFQRVNYGMRTILGWCALAMLTAAIGLYLFIVR